MDAKSANELYLIKQELNSIIRELEDIESGVRNNFKGIGNDKCANSINTVLNNYKKVKRSLDNIDTSKVTEEFLERQKAKG